MSSLPFGWEDRHNTMSEKDMALGGAAATKFADKKSSYSSVYQNNDGDLTYKSSDDVRAHYLKQMEIRNNNNNISAEQSATQNDSVPIGWNQREKAKEVEAAQYGAFSSSTSSTAPSMTTHCAAKNIINYAKQSSSSASSSTAEVALVQVTTNSLDALASVLEGKEGIDIPSEERSKFAAAIKRAMDAMVNCR